MAGRGRRWASLLAGMLVITSVVACGGDDAQAEAQRIVLGAAHATFATGTAQVLVTLEGLGDDDGSGQVDFENLLSQVDVDLDGEPTTVIVDGEDVFVGLNDTFTQDLDGLPDVATIVLFLQPLQALQILNGADGDIDIVGDDDIDGVAVTHYQVTVDLMAALDALDGADRAALQAAIDRLGSDSLVVEVWIDDDGVVRRLSSDIDLGGGRTLSVTLDFEDFGSPVRIRVPRERSVVETAEDLELATAEVSGRWTSTSAIVSSTNPTLFPVGPEGEGVLDLRCGADGNCRNRESGNDWASSGPGQFTITAEDRADCTDNATGALVLADSATFAYETVWTVTDIDEEGRAVAMTSAGTIRAEVTPEGRARDCPFDGGGFSATADRTGEATRAG